MNQQNSDAEMRFVNSTTSSPILINLLDKYILQNKRIVNKNMIQLLLYQNQINQPSNNLLVLTKKKIRKELSQNQKCNSGHWTPEEHQTYVEFLQNHQTQSISSQENKKTIKSLSLCLKRLELDHHHNVGLIIKNSILIPQQVRKESKTNKQLNSNFQIKLPINNLIKQFYTPDLKPNLEPMLNFQDCHESQDIQQEESFKIRIRKYSYSNFDDNQNIYNSHYNLLLE